MTTYATTITWADIVRLKKAAKAAKSTNPNRMHSQLLDALAHQDFGVRHFHELLRRYEASVASHVELAGMHHCRFCHLNFSDYDAGDRKLHLGRHQRFEDALLSMKFLPMSFKECENLKRDFGYNQLYLGEGGARRMGALGIMLSHYDRSLELALEDRRWHKHPCLVEYIPWAIANSSYLDDALRPQLEAEFGTLTDVSLTGHPDWPSDMPAQFGWSSSQAATSRQLRETILAAYEMSKSADAAQP